MHLVPTTMYDDFSALNTNASLSALSATDFKSSFIISIAHSVFLGLEDNTIVCHRYKDEFYTTSQDRPQTK